MIVSCKFHTYQWDWGERKTHLFHGPFSQLVFAEIMDIGEFESGMSSDLHMSAWNPTSLGEERADLVHELLLED